MATKPTTLPRWATDGAALLVEPNEGKKDIGWVVAEPPPAQVINWQENLTYQWCAYLDDLEAQALTFTNKITMSGTGGAFCRRTPYGTLTNADATITVEKDTYVGASLTASRFYTLKSTSPAPPAGARIHFMQKNAYGGGYNSRFRRESLSVIADVPATSWATFEFDGTDWFTVAWASNVTGVV